mgnify:CR=1 FL=1
MHDQNNKISRKEFLKFISGMALAAVAVKFESSQTAISAVLGKTTTHKGYGASAYGGSV